MNQGERQNKKQIRWQLEIFYYKIKLKRKINLTK